MTTTVLTVLAISAVPWVIGLATLGVGRWLDAPAETALEITDDTGRTHRVEAIS